MQKKSFEEIKKIVYDQPEKMTKAQFKKYREKNATPAEKVLLKYFKRDGYYKDHYKFQHQIGPYFVDFFIPPKLIIELDGISHIGQKTKDDKRQGYLEREGYRVIRFRNSTVYGNINYVIQRINNSN